jgi:serine/threonine protein kinase
VKHPNVLLVLGADVHDGRAGMWTELLDGATFEQLLTGLGPANWREISAYGIELCRALAAVHAVGLVHRDVKAANVMRERGGRIVLMDFGSAGEYEVGAAKGATPDASPGGMEGTPLAMAPEVLRGGRAGPASDLYSLGVLLFRLVAGDYPVPAHTLDELREALARGPLPSLRSVRPDVPLEFADVVARALERDPADRFKSAVEMERALVAAFTSAWLAPSEAAPAATSPAVSPARVEGRKPGSRAVVWAAAALVVAEAVAGLWWAKRPVSDRDAIPMQFTLDLPVGEHLAMFANLTVSPDGGKVAFASIDTSGTSALWVRRFDSLSSTRLPGTEGATYPFWSPDGKQLAFYASGRLKRIGLDGDSVRVICQAEAGRGGSWGTDGTVLLAPSLVGPLQRVRANGGVDAGLRGLRDEPSLAVLPAGRRPLPLRHHARARRHLLVVRGLAALGSPRLRRAGGVGRGVLVGTAHLPGERRAGGAAVQPRHAALERRPAAAVRDPRLRRLRGRAARQRVAERHPRLRARERARGTADMDRCRHGRGDGGGARSVLRSRAVAGRSPRRRRARGGLGAQQHLDARHDDR